MKKVLIIGSRGSLAKCIIKHLKNFNVLIFKISRNEIDFNTNKSTIKLNQYLKKIEPDIIINCVGIFKDNNFSFENMFNINTKIGWNLINFYRLKIKKKVRIILIGSSAYNKPRQNYILYIASKSALNSMVKSAKDLFLGSNIKLNIINPPAMKSRMRDKFYKNKNLRKKKSIDEIDPMIIAKKIINKF